MNRILRDRPREPHRGGRSPASSTPSSRRAVARRTASSTRPIPSSQLACTIGGNVAENSGGPHTLKYGTTTNHVLALELVLPDGELRRARRPDRRRAGLRPGRRGRRQRGHARHRDARSTVRLAPMPERGRDAARDLPRRGVGVPRGGRRSSRAGSCPRRSRSSTSARSRAVEASVYAAGLPRDAGAVLLVELDGPAVAVPRAGRARARALRGRRARDASRSRATTPSASASGARARARSARWAGSRPISTCTTRSCRAARCPRCSSASARSATATACALSNVFHAGDGNLHPNISFDRRDPERARARDGARARRSCASASRRAA